MSIINLIGGVLGSIPSVLGFIFKTEELNTDVRKRNAAWMAICFCLILGSCYVSSRGDNSALSFAECVKTICSINVVREIIGNEKPN